MTWLSLKLAVDGDRAEALSDALMAAGALSVSVEDRDAGTEAEEAQFGEPGLADPKSWKHNWLVALLEADADVPALIAGLGLPADSEHSIETVEEQDWVRLTQSQFDPIPISGRLWIVPSWHEAPDPEAIAIVLDPGLAFGTGSHPTTRLCLQWLEANLAGGESVLDYGCGSGILAIAAAKLGAAAVVGVDIDPQAVGSARDNAERNGVAIEFMLPEDLAPPTLTRAAAHPSVGLRAGPLDGEGLGERGRAAKSGTLYDIVVANILTNPLKALMPLLAAHVRPGGRIVLSGILDAQAEEVMAIYSQAFAMAHQATEEGWALLTGTRK